MIVVTNFGMNILKNRQYYIKNVLASVCVQMCVFCFYLFCLSVLYFQVYWRNLCKVDQ